MAPSAGVTKKRLDSSSPATPASAVASAKVSAIIAFTRMPQRARHLAVLRRGPQPPADLGAGEKQMLPAISNAATAMIASD